MRGFALFLVFAALSSSALWYAGREERSAPGLPDESPTALPDAVLSGADLRDEYGAAPFLGSVRKLDDLVLRVLDDGAVKYYLRLERLVRRDGKPSMEAVRCAVFDKPKGGLPRLRVMFHAPLVSADLRTLVHGGVDTPKVVRLEGGVRAVDNTGRVLAETEWVELDVETSRVASEADVVLRQPGGRLEVAGTGFDADFDLRSARIRKRVVARLPGILARAQGPATLVQKKDGAPLTVTVQGRVEVDHEAGALSGDSLTATLVAKGKHYELERATLDGHVRIELRSDRARGLEYLELPRAIMLSPGRIACEGPVHGRWSGRIAAFGLGERTLDFEAGALDLFLDGRTVVRARVSDGIRARDQAGGGSFSARVLEAWKEGGRIFASGDIKARTAEGSIEADGLSVEAPGKKRYTVHIAGKKRLEYVADGRFGPLGGAKRGKVVVTSGGPITLAADGEAMEAQALRGVTVKLGEATLRCGALRLSLRKKEVRQMIADLAVTVEAPDGTLSGKRLVHENDRTTLTGSPASVERRDQGVVTAARIVLDKDRTFAATDGVVVVATLAKRGSWTLRAETLRGVFSEKAKRPDRLHAGGGVVLTGPDGRRLNGARLEYDGATQVVALDGEPATVAQGDDLVVSAKSFSAQLRDDQVVRLETAGAADAYYETRAGELRRWHIRFRGPALLEGRRLVIDDGADLAAFDAVQSKRLVGRAGRVVVELDAKRKPIGLKGSGGVTLESLGKRAAKVDAQRLSYTVGSKRVVMRDRARVRAEGWPREVRFGLVVFTVTKDGVDLKRASEIEVFDRSANRK